MEPSPPTPDSSPAPDASEGQLRRAVLLACLLLIPVQISLRLPMDPDIYWHMAGGRWICSNGLPVNDPFSAYGADKPWIVYSWLFEVGAYGLYALGGRVAVAIVQALLALAIGCGLLRLAHRFSVDLRVTVVACVLAYACIGLLLTPRPWLFTILFTILQFELVLGARAGEGTRRLYLIPCAFAVWANLHIQFVYGLLLLACFGVDAVVALWRGGGSRDYTKHLVIAGLLSGVATLCTPYHVRVYLEVMTYAGQSDIYGLINELKPLTFESGWAWFALAMGVTAGWSLGARRVRDPLGYGLLVLALVLGGRMRRDVWVLAIVGTCLIAGFPRVAPVRAYALPRAMALRAVAIALAVGALLLPLSGITPSALRAEDARLYPVAAADHVREQAYRGPLFNHFDEGGYLIWALPDYPVSMDGRTNVHGAERVKRCHRTWEGLPGWNSDPDLVAANVVIAPRKAGANLIVLLDADVAWERVFDGPVSIVFVRRGAGEEQR